MIVPPAVVLWPMRGPAMVSGLDPAQIAGGWVLSLEELGLLFIVVCMFVSASSLVVRFRRAGGRERQQLKWLTYAGVVFVVVFVCSIFVPQPVRASEIWPLVSLVLLVTVYPSIPVAVGVAILRHRLYDIDVIINRTLVYGALTATLALVYFGGVASSQLAFRTLSGQQQQPQLAIVISTLAIAALFNPLRRRIQSFIDRRFYRGKYDAAKTLEDFGSRLREDTDLDSLSGDLVGVVRKTMQPEQVSLWLRQPGRNVAGEESRP
jgi:hypothetical protein